MGQPVKISAELVREARQTGAVLRRSIAGQIELWAMLGRAIEPLLEGRSVAALRKAGRPPTLSSLMASIGTAVGVRRLEGVLSETPYPHYMAAPGRPGWLVRTDAAGRKITGRFLGRRFTAAP